MRWIGYPSNQVSLALRLQAFASILGSKNKTNKPKTGVLELSSGPHVCVSNTLNTELFLWLYKLSLLLLFY